MNWLIFSYTLPAKGKSSPRVSLWRRLQYLGAIDLTGLYVLPETPETLESISWLAQEVKTTQGDATVMQVQKFHSLSDKGMIEKFNRERSKDYQLLVLDIEDYQKGIAKELKQSQSTKALGKLKRQFEGITRIDFFASPMKAQVAKMLEKLEQPAYTSINVKVVKRQDYQDKTWVTRPKPYIDRLASIWLIHTFIDPKAEFRYHDKAKSNEISFDMPDARFGHTGNLCTFETLLHSFGIKDNTVQKMAPIIHELDLQDDYYSQSESFGIEAILKGWLKQNLKDKELEIRGLTLFEGLYQSLKEKP